MFTKSTLSRARWLQVATLAGFALVAVTLLTTRDWWLIPSLVGAWLNAVICIRRRTVLRAALWRQVDDILAEVNAELARRDVSAKFSTAV